MSDLALREFHQFEAAGSRFLYLAPSAGIFALDECSSAVLDSLASAPRDAETLVAGRASVSESEDSAPILTEVELS